jgi:hypothetical protein
MFSFIFPCFSLVQGKHVYTYLVGGFNHLEKYQSMGRIIPYIIENKKCLKPPTRYIYT